MAVAYNYEEYKQKALKAIRSQRLHFIEDVCYEIGMSRQTFYKRGFDNDDMIKEAINEQKRWLKRGLRMRWANNDNPTLQIVLYRLLADAKEFDRLTQQKIEHTGKDGGAIKIGLANFKQLSDAELQRIAREQSKQLPEGKPRPVIQV